MLAFCNHFNKVHAAIMKLSMRVHLIFFEKIHIRRCTLSYSFYVKYTETQFYWEITTKVAETNFVIVIRTNFIDFYSATAIIAENLSSVCITLIRCIWNGRENKLWIYQHEIWGKIRSLYKPFSMKMKSSNGNRQNKS